MRATLHRRIAGPHLPRASRVARAVRGAGTALLVLAIAGPAFAQSGNDAVYRFYNRETGTHFYTISVGERDSVIAAYPQFAYEGAQFAARAQPAAGTVPVFRFYNRTTGTHFYTTSASERDGIVAYYPQFAYEGPAYHAMPEPGSDGRVAVYRFFNRNTGAHFYTSSEAERDKVVASYPAFVYEGIAFYVHPAATAAAAPVVVRVERRMALPAAGVVRTHARGTRADRRDRRSRVPRRAVRGAAQRLSRGRVRLPVARRVPVLLVRRVAQQRVVRVRARPADALQAAQPVLRQRARPARPAPAARGVGAVAALRRVRHEGPGHGDRVRAGAVPRDPVRRGVRQLRDRC